MNLHRNRERFKAQAEKDDCDGVDPRLQARQWHRRADSGSAKLQVVSVLARLRHESDEPKGLKIRARNGRLVTGSIDLEDLAKVRRQVDGLKLSTRCISMSPDLSAEAGIVADGRRPIPDSSLDGNGVIVGVVDVDCAFAHPSFCDPKTGKTRFVRLWDQRGDSNKLSPKPYGYGREFDTEDINSALASKDPYAHLRYEAEDEAEPHGTRVLELAAGSQGVARRAGLVFVHLAPEEKISQPHRRAASFCDSDRLVEAVKYVFDVAAELGRPAVVNVSLAGQAGPHDGSSLVEQSFDEMLTAPGRAIVLAAGNTRMAALHARALVPAGKASRLYWWVPPHDQSANELDVWYPGEARLIVRVGLLYTGLPAEGSGEAPKEPEWVSQRPLEPGTFWKLFSREGGAGVRGDSRYRGSVHHRARDSQNGDHEVFAYLVRTPTVEWVACVLEFRNEGDTEAAVDAWIDNDSLARSNFLYVARQEGTVSGIATGKRPIVVGASRASQFDATATPLNASAIGPARRGGRPLPDLLAPGQYVEVASWDPKATRGVASGTSFAAPQVAGLAAKILQQEPSLTCEEVRHALQKGA